MSYSFDSQSQGETYEADILHGGMVYPRIDIGCVCQALHLPQGVPSTHMYKMGYQHDS